MKALRIFDCCILLLLISYITTAFGQDKPIIIRGSVVDQVTGAPLSYTNVSYDEGRKGGISNEDGIFQLSVHPDYFKDSLVFSYIGYVVTKVAISDAVDQNHLIVAVSPAIYQLSNVIIRDIDPRKLLVTALNNIEDQFITTNHLLTGFFRESVRHPGLDEVLYLAEGVLKSYKLGYKNNPKYKKLKRKKKRQSHTVIDSGYVAQDEHNFTYLGLHFALPQIVNGPLIPSTVDMLDYSQFILCTDYLIDLDLTYHRYEEIAEEGYYIIKFSPKESSDYVFQGELFYNIEREVITEARYEYNHNGIDLYNDFNDLIQLRSRAFHVAYTLQGGKYALSFIRINNQFETARIGHLLENKIEYITTQCEINDVQPFKKAQWLHSGSNFQEGLHLKGLKKWTKASIIPRSRAINRLVDDREKPDMSDMIALPTVSNRKIGYKSYQLALDDAKVSRKPIFMMSSASWCPPCQKMKQTVLSDKEVIEFINTNFHPVYNNVERLRGRRLAEQFNVGPIPTFTAIGVDESILASRVGYTNKEEFLSVLQKFLEINDFKKGGSIKNKILDKEDVILSKNSPKTKTSRSEEGVAVGAAEYDLYYQLMHTTITEHNQFLLRSILKYKDEMIQRFGARRYHEKVLQATISSNVGQIRIFPRTIKLLLDKITPELSDLLFWRYLRDDYLHRLYDTKASAIAGLQFLCLLPSEYLHDYHDMIHFVAINLEYNKDLTKLYELLKAANSQEWEMTDHINYLKDRLGIPGYRERSGSTKMMDSMSYFSRYSDIDR